MSVGCLNTLIAITGQSVLDRTTWPDGRREDRLGGAPVFAAQALAGRDPAVAVVLTQGGDDALRQPLCATGLEVIAGSSPRTTIYDVSLHGDGSWHEAMSAVGNPFTPRDVGTWMAAALRALLGRRVRLALARRLPARDARRTRPRPGAVSGWAGPGAAAPARPSRGGRAVDRDAVAGVRVLKLSEAEALALIGGIDAGEAAATGVPFIVVTRGERGAVMLSDGVATEVSVKPVDLADTVGAGDAFLALMAAAEMAGAAPVEAVGRACDGVAILLRSRLAAEITVQRAQTAAT